MQASIDGKASPRETNDDSDKAPLLDLNHADSNALQTLPAIGPARARAILALRARLGRFRHLAQLLRVHGIGRRTLARLRPLVVVEKSTAAAGSPPAAQVPPP